MTKPSATTLAALHELLTNIAPPYQEWRERAACRGINPALFIMERGDSGNEAKRVCQGCQVREECLEFAMGNVERVGIWGGTSDRERRRMRRDRKDAA